MQRTRLSPEQAARLLRGSIQNKVNLHQARLLARRIDNGTWAPGPPIELIDGRLHDGHHRVLAIVLAGKPTDIDILSVHPPVTDSRMDIRPA